MRNVWRLVGIILVIATLVGCQQAEPTPAASADSDTPALVPPMGGQGGLDNVNRLALGTLELEESDDAVTAAQATELLPLWKIIQGGTLKSAAETEAVVKQIESKMTASQLAAIEAMELTMENMQTWMQEQGIEMQMPARPSAQGGQGGPGAFGDLSDEERAQMREQMQSLTPEERATRMAEMGVQPPQGGEGARPPGGGAMGGSLLLEPLIEFLTERAG